MCSPGVALGMQGVLSDVSCPSSSQSVLGFPGGSDGKESACNAGDPGSIYWGKIPWRREWQPTLVFLPGEFRGQRSLVSFSPWGGKESDTTE